MTGNVYSDYQLAKDKAQSKMKELEQDIFICSCDYQSGKEFVLKVRAEMMNGADYLYVLKLPFNHKFKNKYNAAREAERFGVELKKKVKKVRHTFTENGYNKFSHFSLKIA